jgi:predicted proteasome-type protease
MTPKQKAEELFNKYFTTGCALNLFYAKQCALVAVDEILNANKEVMYSIDFVEYQDALNLRAKVKSETEIFVYYWKQVKKEIVEL